MLYFVFAVAISYFLLSVVLFFSVICAERLFSLGC
ncbi:Uncharacterised protein [Serratia quinivorans]|nr:Uncharacterised protein [Serratia quinivorans]